MYKYIKRLIDIIASLFFLIVLTPLLLFLTVLGYFKLGKPVIFVQKRPGLDGKIFRMFKFRTMNNERNSDGELLDDKFRVTRYGDFLRRSSFDELPELINVLKGDMSLVGPRPLLVKYLPLYNEEQFKRHNVRPGITGYSQVNGRNSITWEDRFKHDLYYVENMSFALDIRILLKTVVRVISRSGVSQEGHVTMGTFKGNNSKVGD
ncbi:sugar transferase [Mycoplasmatota bacterium]|nr:sugar transferase [Mycoplasmatota bacterium]